MRQKMGLITLFIGVVSSLWINFTISHQVLGQTPEQISQLKEAEVPVILPTYIPKGFRLINFLSNVNDERVNSKDAGCCGPGCSRMGAEKHEFCWYYQATYKGPNNSSFIVKGTNLPIGDGLGQSREWLIDTDNFGEVVLLEATYENSGSALYATFRYSSPDHPVYFFYSPDPDFSNSSNSISPQEASKIIQSLQFKYP